MIRPIMRLAAYAQAVEPGFIQLWVGLFDVEQPPAPTFRIARMMISGR